MPSNNGSPLAVKLLRQTLAVLWVIIITLLAVDILVDYKTHRSDVNTNQAKQLSLLTPALTKALDTGQIDTTRQLIKEFLVNSSIHSATIAYADGKFHVVWKNSSTVFYRTIDVSSVSGITAPDEQLSLNLYPNPAENPEIVKLPFLSFKTNYKNTKARCLKVHAESELKMPNSHINAGKPAILYADEIVVY